MLELLTVGDAATILGVSTAMVRKLVASRCLQVAAKTPGNMLLFARGDVERTRAGRMQRKALRALRRLSKAARRPDPSASDSDRTSSRMAEGSDSALALSAETIGEAGNVNFSTGDFAREPADG